MTIVTGVTYIHVCVFIGSLTWKLAGSPIMSLLITLRLGCKGNEERKGRGDKLER